MPPNTPAMGAERTAADLQAAASAAELLRLDVSMIRCWLAGWLAGWLLAGWLAD